MPRPAGQSASGYFDYRDFPVARVPRTRGGIDEQAVVVVGAGPVGLAAALALARAGVNVSVIDLKTRVSDGSRAICIARHSFDLLQSLGVEQRFLAKALPWTHGTSYYRGRPVFRLEMPHDADQRFFPMYNLQQQYIELYLAEAAAAIGNIDLRWGHRLEQLAIEADGRARLAIDSPHGHYASRARYVVAADGARSRVRELLDLKLRGAAYEARYVIVDVRMRSAYPTERRAFFDSVANPGATVLVHKQPEDIWRIDYQLQDDEDETVALAESTIRSRVQAIVDMLGETVPWELEWWSVYKAYTLCLDDYRHGPVFFAGDAAHLVPIFGVRGLNSGLADAGNLAWKLAATLHGWGAPELLDSYSSERRGATLEIFAQAGRSTRFMSPPSHGHRLVRDAALQLALRCESARRLLDPRQSRPYSYAASALTTLCAEIDYLRGPLPGEALGDLRLQEGDFLSDRLGRGFNLLVVAREGLERPQPAAVEQTAARRRIPFKTVFIDTDTIPATSEVFHRLGAEPLALYLLRPDRYVCARWRQWDGERIVSALARAAGRPQHDR